MSTQSNGPSLMIVVGVDFEPQGDLALDQAIMIAASNPNAEIHALYVDKDFKSAENEVSADGTLPNTHIDRLEERCRVRMQTAEQQRGKLGFKRLVTHFSLGTPAEQLVQLAGDVDADIIILGTHNRQGIKRLVLGSVAEKVVKIARCPVYIVRPKDHEALGDIPEIEPPCPDCTAKQKETDGAELWCERHARARFHPRTHRYSYAGGPMSAHESFKTTT